MKQARFSFFLSAAIACVATADQKKKLSRADFASFIQNEVRTAWTFAKLNMRMEAVFNLSRATRRGSQKGIFDTFIGDA